VTLRFIQNACTIERNISEELKLQK